jgi:hypothetical protein
MTSLKVAHDTENVFGLDTSQNYKYQVYSYSINHSLLAVRVFDNSENSFNLMYECFFGGVSYIDLSSSWEGSVFRTASQEQCSSLMQELGMYAKRENRIKPLDQLTDDTVALYESSPPNRRKIRILALNTVELHHIHKGIGES